ncbi:MAG: tetratricopeptide repeat protein, partial [bacterium]
MFRTKTNGLRYVVVPLLFLCLSTSISSGQTNSPSNKDFQQAIQHLKKKKFKQAAPLLKKASKKGNPQAMFLLSGMYRSRSEGPEQDLDKSRKWLIRAGKHGHLKSIELLSKLYGRENKFAEKDPKREFKWVKKMVEETSSFEYTLRMGTMLAEGTGTQQNMSRACSLFRSMLDYGKHDLHPKAKKNMKQYGCPNIWTPKSRAEELEMHRFSCNVANQQGHPENPGDQQTYVQYRKRPKTVKEKDAKMLGAGNQKYRLHKVGKATGKCAGNVYVLEFVVSDGPCKPGPYGEGARIDGEPANPELCGDHRSMYRFIKTFTNLVLIPKASKPGDPYTPHPFKHWLKETPLAKDREAVVDTKSSLPGIHYPPRLSAGGIDLKYNSEGFGQSVQNQDGQSVQSFNRHHSDYGRFVAYEKYVYALRPDGSVLQFKSPQIEQTPRGYVISNVRPRMDDGMLKPLEYSPTARRKQQEWNGSMKSKFRTLRKTEVHDSYPLYVLKNPNTPRIKNGLYRQFKEYVKQFNESLNRKKKSCQHDWMNADICDMEPWPELSFEQFIQLNPIVYRKDPLGRWVELKKKTMRVPGLVEPLIYLYPEQTREVSIQVQDPVQLEATVPTYNDGWTVQAHPNGSLGLIDSDQSVESLFWEGKSLPFRPVQSGWIIKRENVRSKLERILKSKGLRDRERQDFLEYWVPRMKLYPYYLVSFVPRSYLSVTVPLNIKPRPDTLIRVHMRYHGF